MIRSSREPVPRVSVVTIFLNPGVFLTEAIESVLAQTYEEWELILVDDGSSDGSTALARRYAGLQAGKIRYVEHPSHRNRGMSASRNLGASCRSGTYIAFLDADDTWLPGKLAEQVRIMDANPAVDLVFGATNHWVSWDADSQQTDWIQSPADEARDIVEPPLPLSLALEGFGFCNTSNFLVRSSAFDAVGGFDDQFTGLFEDLAFLSKVFVRSPTFACRTVWENYRHHPASACAIAERQGGYDRPFLSFLLWLERYMTAGHVTNERLWRAFHSRRNMIEAALANLTSGQDQNGRLGSA